MTVQKTLEAFYENTDYDLIPLYMANLVSIGWLGFLTLSMFPEADLGLIPEATAALMVLLTVAPFLSGATAAVDEWRDTA